jgi:oxygen-independent coproporphyrinogen-3 oxidase
LKKKGEMLEMMSEEMNLRADFFPKNTKIETIYFGGGTPSVLTPQEIHALILQAASVFSFSLDALVEITMEANPEDLTDLYLEQLAQTPVNRLSIGIQSFILRDLTLMNRAHLPQRIPAIIQNCRKHGFENISIDMIFGIPDVSVAEWEDNLQQALALKVPHISVYALTVEAKTELAYLAHTQQIMIPNEEVYAQQFLVTDKYLEAAGYMHYELSNYAQPHSQSIHNGNYWRGMPYLGIGPSAHSFDGACRWGNVANNAKYVRGIRDRSPCFSLQERLSRKDVWNEYIMTQLRTKQGINLEKMEASFGRKVPEKDYALLIGLCEKGIMVNEDGYFRFTPRGWLISDAIIAELFWI